MKRIYRGFKTDCPTGLNDECQICANIDFYICAYDFFSLNMTYAGLGTEDIFYSIFSKFFPLGGDTYNGGRK